MQSAKNLVWKQELGYVMFLVIKMLSSLPLFSEPVNDIYTIMKIHTKDLLPNYFLVDWTGNSGMLDFFKRFHCL